MIKLRGLKKRYITIEEIKTIVNNPEYDYQTKTTGVDSIIEKG